MPPFSQNPGHLHLLLNHIPIIGLGVATLGLILSLCIRNRGAQFLAVILVITTCASIWPVYKTGESAYIGIRGITDDTGVDWLDTHLERADRTILLFGLPPVFGMLAIFLSRKFPRAVTPLLFATLLASFACLAAAGYIADAGGKIRHPETRIVAPQQLKNTN